MLRTLSLSLSTVLLAVVLVACGGESPKKSAPPPVPPDPSIYNEPIDGAFTLPVATGALSGLTTQAKTNLETKCKNGKLHP